MAPGARFVFALLLVVPLSASSGLQEGYVRPEACRSCHQRLFDGYKKTPMGRSFYLPDPKDLMADWEVNSTFYHSASDRYYEMNRRDDELFIGRYQLDQAGKRVNEIEKKVTHIIGSGELVRIYLHKTRDGRIFELPAAWYRQGKIWAMPPGYDRPRHPGFTRQVTHKCMFCHNGYPAVRPGSDLNRRGEDVRFTGYIPMGIDCQRCHGPGARHIEAASTGDVEGLRDSIVNPSKLSDERRFEVCLQCHMETTSFFLPDSYRRLGRGIYSYRPGEPLLDYIVHFDHAAGTGHEDKFQIGSTAYRLRKSVCFQESIGKLTCTTCHNPHKRPRPEQRAAHYRLRCLICHSESDGGKHSMLSGKFLSANCVSCHMPRRRTEDGIHVVVTDHMIQRFRGSRDLLAAQREKTYEEQLYHGRVDIYLPKQGLEEFERDLYWGIAQVKDQANLKAGVKVLKKLLDRANVPHPEPYYELAEAQVALRKKKAARRNYLRALEHDANFVQARNNLGLLLLEMGEIKQAIAHYRQALFANPGAAEVYNNLGVALLESSNHEEALEAFRNAIKANPMYPMAHLNFGKQLFAVGRIQEARIEFEQVLAIEPAQAEAHNNLGLILLGLGRSTEAFDHLNYALAHGNKEVKASAEKALAILDLGGGH